MQNGETYFYDKYSKLCLTALVGYVYRWLETGVFAKVGDDRSQELADLFGKSRRFCDMLFELLDAALFGKTVKGGLHIEVQTRWGGDELFRMCGYFGRIVEKLRYLYFVQAIVLLTPLPKRALRRIWGFPNAFNVYVMDLTRFDGTRWLALGRPEAAVFALLSRVVKRNLLIAGVVQILTALPHRDDRKFWLEICLGFANLRPDKRYFKMELIKEMERSAPTDERKQEIRLIYGDLFKLQRKKGFVKGKQKGFDEGKQKGFDEGKQKGFDEGKQKGFDEGKQKGFDEGKQKGVDETLIAVVRTMLAAGEPLEKICAFTGLEKARVVALHADGID